MTDLLVAPGEPLLVPPTVTNRDRTTWETPPELYERLAPALPLVAALALALVAWEPAVRLAAWGVLWAAHVGCGYPAPPAYTAWGPLP